MAELYLVATGGTRWRTSVTGTAPPLQVPSAQHEVLERHTLRLAIEAVLVPCIGSLDGKDEAIAAAQQH